MHELASGEPSSRFAYIDLPNQLWPEFLNLHPYPPEHAAEAVTHRVGRFVLYYPSGAIGCCEFVEIASLDAERFSQALGCPSCEVLELPRRLLAIKLTRVLN